MKDRIAFTRQMWWDVLMIALGVLVAVSPDQGWGWRLLGAYTLGRHAFALGARGAPGSAVTAKRGTAMMRLILITDRKELTR